ncbi:hypothetical protein [Legionella israelensis]|uniref:hypothetical protein n=1 Tax=Legionella israelensis TaxID=454 RepID=UPI000B13E582|nr:hypothetical protein [Legionella israelensis]
MDTAVDARVIRTILFFSSHRFTATSINITGVLLWSLIYCIHLLEKWLKSRFCGTVI